MKRTLLAMSIASLLVGAAPALVTVNAQAEAVAWDEAGQVWLTQESANFRLHFRQGHEAQALRSLDIAEQVHNELQAFFRYQPTEKTEIVLVDDYDFSNGWATPLPFAQIRLFMSPPDDINSLENNDEWLHMLIRHEYAHILHMEMAEGGPAFLRSIIGRNPLTFPHALTPSFMLEGLAVYLETNKNLGYGRLQGNNFAMEMRMEVAKGDLRDLSEVAIAEQKLPWGSAYLYGAYFMEYLTETYSEEKLQDFLTDYSKQIIPFFFLQSSAERAFGKDFDVLWVDFQAYLETKFKAQVAELSAEAVSGKLVLQNISQQVLTSSSAGLFVNVANGEDSPELKQVNYKNNELFKQSAWQSLPEQGDIIAMDHDPEFGLLATHYNGGADGRVYADVSIMLDDEWESLSDKERFRNARWIRGTGNLLASRKQDGLSELWLLDSQQKQDNQLIWRGEQDEVLGDYTVSADGQSLVASVKRARQGWNLEVLDLQSKLWTVLTNTKAVENSPSYAPNGEVIYSADYDGIYNIYSINLESQVIRKLTHEVGGAFSPTWQPELGLIYQSYDSQGYAIRNIPYPKTLKVLSHGSVKGSYNYPEPVTKSAQVSQPTPYQPWPSLRPRSWLPVLSDDGTQSLIGVSTNGSDALGRHNYEVTAAWDTENSVAEYNLLYAYDNRWQFALERSHDFTEFKQGNQTSERIEQEDSALIQRNYLFNEWLSPLSLHAGVYWDKTSQEQAPSFNVSPYKSFEESLAGLALTLDSREYLVNVPGVASGMYAELVVETNEAFNSDFSGEKYQGKWGITFDLPGKTTATMQFSAGYADDEAKAFRLGGSDFADDGQLFGRDNLLLRGYERGAQIGQKYVTQRANITTHLARIEQNWGLYPIGVGDISSSLFVDSGAVWNDGQDRKQLSSIGASVTMDVVLGYMYIPLTVGYAHGFDDKLGKDKVYATFGFTFD